MVARRNSNPLMFPVRSARAALGMDDQPERPGDELFWPAVLVLIAGWLVFAWPWLSGRVTIPWDAKAHFLPQVQFLAASIARGEWPFWTPNVFGGHPQIADPQSQMFSPPMLLLALIDAAPGNRAIDATVLLSVLGGGLGVMLLFREYRWHPAGGLIAALGFAFGAAMAWRLQHYGQVLSLCYLPFALLFLKRGLERGSGWYGLAAGVTSGLIVAGRDQVALLEVYLLAGFVVAYLAGDGKDYAQRLRTSILPLAGGVVGGAAVASIPLLLTMLLAADSNRPAIDFVGAGRGSLHPALLLTAVTPHLYGAAGEMANYWGPPSFAWQGTDLFIAQNVGVSYIGALPLLMLMAGLVRGDAWAPGIRFYTIALVVCLLYGLGWYTPVFRAMYEVLPGVSLYRRPADAVFLIGALAAIVAGYTMHRLAIEAEIRLRPAHILIVLAMTGLLFAGAAVAGLAMERLPQAAGPLVIGAVWFAAAITTLGAAWWLRPIRPIAAIVLLGGGSALDLAWNNGPNGASGLPPTLVEMLEPDTDNETIRLLQRKVAETKSATRRDRVELAGLGFHWPNASLTHGLENTLGYNPVRLRTYTAATGAEDHSGLPDQRRFAPLFPSYRSKLSDLLGLRFIATGVPVEQIDKRLKPGDLRLVARTKHGYVYENPGAMPRAMFATTAQQADFAGLLRDGQWPDVDLASTVLLQSTANSPAQARQPGRVAIRSYRNTEVVIDVDSADGGWVVLNDVWHPWWRATIDGRPREVQRANVLFRAVQVPPGRHIVRFAFRPLEGAWRQVLGRDGTAAQP